MPLTLPSSPTNGQQVTYENTKFTFSSAKNVWMRETLASRIESDIIPTTNTSLDTAAISGSNLVFTKVDGTTSNVSLQSMASGSVSVYATESDLPSTGVQAGDHAFVTATNDLYIRTATQWRNIDAVNLTPTISASISSHSFGTIGESIDITYTTSEPEGTPVTVTTSNTGITNTSQVDISHHTGNNTVTVVAGASELSGGTLTIAVTDGTNIGTASVTLDVSYSVWTSGSEQAVLTANDASSGDAFGHGVSISSDGTYAVVGAYVENFNNTTDAGSVYIFTKSGTTWTEQAKFSASDVSNGDYFGVSVDIDADGDTVVVGARRHDNETPGQSGAAYIFTRSGTSWSQQAKITRQGVSPNMFGVSVGITDDGNTIAIGTDGGGNPTSSGMVVTYTRSGTSWSHQQTLVTSDAAANDYFGRDVTISGDGAYISSGSIEDDGGGGNGSGSAYVFKKESFSISGVTQPTSYPYVMQGGPPLTQNPQGIDFNADGSKMFIISDVTQGGLTQWNLSTPFDVSTLSYAATADITAQIGTDGGGIKFSPDGTRMFVSRAHSLAAGNESVFQYNLSTGFDLSTISYSGNSLSVSNSLDARTFGIEFNNDGSKMYIVTDPGNGTDGLVREYTLSTPYDLSTASFNYLFTVGAQESEVRGIAFNTDGTKMFISGQEYKRVYSYSLSTAFDISTASYDNVSINVNTGTIKDNSPTGITFNNDGSKLYVLGDQFERVMEYATPSSWSQQAKIAASDGSSNDKFGTSVALDQDGNTLIVGARGADEPNNNQGACYIFTRSGTTWTEQAKLVSGTTANDAEFGSSVSISNDGNIAIGVARRDPNASVGPGKIYVFERSGTTWTLINSFAGSNQSSSGYLAYEAPASEISGDGQTIIAGNHSHNNTTGAAYIFVA